MKNTYALLPIALTLIVASVTAKKSNGQLNLQPTKMEQRISNQVPIATPALPPGGPKAPAVFTETFSSGIGAWTITDNAGGGDLWSYIAGGGTTGDGTGLASTTSSDGYAAFDSDGLGNNSQNEDCDLISPAIDASSLTTVGLSFNHYFRSGFGGSGTVYVRPNATSSWTQVAAFSGSTTANAAVESIDITSICSGATAMQIRFQWIGDWSYYWLIDDISVDEAAANDVALANRYYFTHLTSFSDQHYTLMPSAQAVLDTMYFAGAVNSGGSQTQTNVTLTTNVTGAASYSYTSAAGLNLNAGQADTINHFPNYFLPTINGTYTVEFYVSADQADDNTSNDTISSIYTDVFTVNDTAYDRSTNVVAEGDGAWLGAGELYTDVSLFQIFTQDTATSISAYIQSFGLTTNGATARMIIYDGALNPVDSSADFTIVTADFNTWKTVGMPNTVLSAGFYYAGMKTLSGDVIIGTGTGAPAASQNTALIRQESNSTWYYASSIPAVRLNLGPVASAGPLCGLVIDSVSSTNVLCFNGSDGTAQVFHSGEVGAVTYSWSGTASTSSSVTGLNANSYTVTVTDAGVSNCSATYTVTITEPSALTASVSSTPESTANANDGSVTATPAGGVTPYSYNWSPGGGTNATETGLAPGTYLVSVTDANGCLYVDSTQVDSGGTAPCTLSVSVMASDETSSGANDGAAFATATGGQGSVTYLWSNSAVVPAIVNLSPGVYCVTATDTAGCTANACDTVLPASGVPCTLSVTVVASDETSSGANDGAAIATATGGQGNVTYSWDNSASTSSILTSLAPNTYCVTVTDTAGCTASACDTVNAAASTPCTLTVTVVASDETSSGANDGAAIATATGGQGSVSYSWNNSSSTTNVITSLAPGTYCVTATDTAGCTASACDTVLPASGVPCTISVTVVASDETTAGANDGNAIATASGGQGNVTYSWNNSTSTSSILTGLAPNTYCVTVTDTLGCVASACDTVNAGAVNIAEQAEGMEVVLYPNPTPGPLRLNVNLEEAELISIEAYNVFGQKVVDITSEKTANYHRLIDTNEWTSGVYFFTISSSKLVTTQKVIIK